MPPKAPGINSDHAIRARAIRIHVEGDDRGAQTRFAKRLGMSPQRWNNYERGNQEMPRATQRLVIRLVPGLTGDWLDIGADGGLTVDLRQALTGAMRRARKGTTRPSGRDPDKKPSTNSRA